MMLSLIDAYVKASVGSNRLKTAPGGVGNPHSQLVTLAKSGTNTKTHLMAIKAQAPQGKEYEPAPKGAHQAVLIGIVDRGMQPNKFKEGNPLEHKLSFHFEINKTDENGNAYGFSKWLTNSTFFSQKTGKMSALVELVSSWLDVTPGEIPSAVFDDLEVLCGLNARVRLLHAPKEGGEGVSVKIGSIEPWTSDDLLQPQNVVKDASGVEGQYFDAKSFEDFWEEVGGQRAATQPLPKAEPRAAAPRNAPPARPAQNGKTLLANAQAKQAAMDAEGDDDGPDIFDGE